MSKNNCVVFIITLSGFFISQFQTLAQSQGPLSPGIRVNNISGGAVAWLNPTNAAASDNVYTTVTNGTSNYLNVSNFGFSIPLTANITGIVAEVERKGAPVNAVASGTWATFTPPNYSSGTATASYGNTSYSYNLPVSSLTNNRRLVVVTVGIENADNVGAADPSVTFGTVTYNGVAMTLATSNVRASATTSNSVAIYYLTESGLPATTGSRTLVISKTINGELSGGSISPAEYVEIVGVNTFTNVEQSTPVTAVSQTTASSPITSPPINDVRNGDFIVAATMNNTSSAGGASVTQATGYTENFELSNNNTGGSTSGALLEVQSKSLAGITGAPSVTVSATAAAASRLVMDAISVNAARVYDNLIILTNALGVQTGDNLAVTPANSLPNAWPDTDTYLAYGGSSNLWGTTWTPLDINSAGFGLSFQTAAINSIASVDHIRITVYYSIPASIVFQSLRVTQTEENVTASFSCTTDDHKKYKLTLEKAGNDLKFKSMDSTEITGSDIIQTVNINDAAPYPGLNYYRIRINEEGKADAEYSTVRQIVFNNKEQLDVIIYPNPVFDYLVVESLSKVISIHLQDVTGVDIPVSFILLDNNTIKVESIPAKGLCTLSITTNTGIITKKIIIN